MKKLMLVALIFVGCFVFYKVGRDLYVDYQFKKHSEEYGVKSYKVKRFIFEKASREIKLNDLIFVCELRKGLWNTDIGVDEIQKEAEINNSKYKSFSVGLKSGIVGDKDLRDFVGTGDTDLNAEIVANLCTLLDPETRSSRSLYGELLQKKYEVDSERGSIEYADASRVTAEDLNEYAKARSVEQRLRLNF